MQLSAYKALFAEHIKLVVFLLGLYILLSFTQIPWRLDQVFYDAQMKYWASEPVEDLVIVAIDEESLRKLGRWPWSRDLHAQLINRLTDAGVKAIFLDMIFAESDRNNPLSDRALADAIARHGKVVLPVLVEQNRNLGQLIETLPLPLLTQAAAGLGHVHLELDQDGIARSTFLKEGLGESTWPNVSVSLYNLLYANGLTNLPGARNPSPVGSANSWVRDYHVYIPFAGPPGHFPRLSYEDIFDPNFPLSILKNKIIFVGATATGMGDILPTPVSGLHQAMPGVEINANIFNAIRKNTLIEPVSKNFQFWLYLLIVFFPVILFPLLNPRNVLITTIMSIVAISVVSIFLLRAQQLWVPPMAAMIVLLSSYPLWSWRKLEFTLKSLNEELNILNEQKSAFSIDIDKVQQAEFEVIAELLDLEQLKVSVPGKNLQQLYIQLSKEKAVTTYAFRVRLKNITQNYQCEILRRINSPLDKSEEEKLLSYVQSVIPMESKGISTLEIIEQRVAEVKDTTLQLKFMQQFIRDSLEQMPDGIIITNEFGSIVNINHRSIELLEVNPEVVVRGLHLSNLKEAMPTSLGEFFYDNTMDALKTQRAVQKNMEKTDDGRVLLNITPIFDRQNELIGLTVSLTDITDIIRRQREKEELIDFLSHDLRTPLVSTLAQLELVANKIPQIEEWPNFIKRQKSLSRKTLSLVEEFVQLTRAENLNAISFNELNFIDAIDNAVDSVWDLAGAKNIEIRTEYSDVYMPIEGDFNTLERIVVNLLSNAIKYSHKNSPIEVNVFVENDMALCEVRDSGIGISPENLKQVFNKFSRFSTNGNAEHSSIGLGLAFVKISVEKHNGHVGVYSELGKGSVFTVRFPLLKE